MTSIRACVLFAAVALTALGGIAFAEDIATGDRVVVLATTTKVMSGSDVVGNVARGTEFAVEQTNGAWLRGTFTVDGKKLIG